MGIPTEQPSVSKELRLGIAGWSIPQAVRHEFAQEGSLLMKYASRFNAVEINSSFYRPHRPQTYRRWAESVSADFRFAVKVPKLITHEQRLRDSAKIFAEFYEQCSALGDKLGVMLVQLPPSLEFEHDVVENFCRTARQITQSPIVCEPRHQTWFRAEAEELMSAWQIGRVAADPALVAAAAIPGGWPSVAYYRWHGSPQMYYSSYESARLQILQQQLRISALHAREVWCIFDNTALGAAYDNALQLL